MSATQLAKRMGVSQQAVGDLERREPLHTLTLATLQKAADAMGADLVYAIVPRQGLHEMIDAQARISAEQQLKRVAHSMGLEDQAVPPAEYSRQLAENQARLVRDWSPMIWNEPEPPAK